MRQFLAKLQLIDRRWVYLGVFIGCTIPFLVTVRLPTVPSRETKGVYDCIEQCPKDKVVLIDSNWDPGSKGENEGQLQVIVDHLFRNNIKFVVIANNAALAPKTSEDICEAIAERYKKEYGVEKKYGVDWANMGVIIGPYDWQIFQGLAKNFWRQYPKDYKGTPNKDLPIMQHVRSIKDIHLVYCVWYTPSENWISFIHAIYGTKLAYGCAGIMSTIYYRYISANQLVGMLVGIRGSAEYDALLYPNDMSKRRCLGSSLIVPLAFGHLVIIFAIILGNIGFFAARQRRKF